MAVADNATPIDLNRHRAGAPAKPRDAAKHVTVVQDRIN
jgi:hypothetical protein